MKNFIKSVAITTLSFFSLIGCSYIDQNQAADVEKLFKEKYNQDFVVTDIGERYGTAKNDSITTYVHLEGKEDLVFKAVMHKDGSLVSDSYIPTVISQSLNKILQKELSADDIDSYTTTVVMNADSSTETDSNITLAKYVTKYNPSHFSGDMIVEEIPELTPEQFEKALTAVYKEGLSTKFQVAIHVISEEDYEECLEKFKQNPVISDAWFRDFNVVANMKVFIDSTGYQIFESSI